MPDEASTRDHIQKHADAVARGDMAAVVADFSLAQAASIRRQNGRKAARAYSGCLRVGPRENAATDIRQTSGMLS